MVSIADDDWTSSSSNGACNCSSDFNNGSIVNFFDSGNALSYGPNENEEITLCPDATGTKMVAVFATNAGYTLNIDPSDTLFVYDGTSTAAPLLAKINDSTYPNGANIPATWNNTSGCLTFNFISDATQQGTGWDANLSCANLTQPFYNHMSAYINGDANGANDNLNDLNPVDTGYVDVCYGDTVQFVAEPYFPYEPGGDSAALSGGGYMQSNSYTVLWELSDGSSYNTNSFTFVPPARNGYYVSLKIEDALGQFHYSFCKIRVSTKPSFTTCEPAQSPICLGRTTELFGGVTSSDTVGVDPVSANFPIGGSFGAQTYLPDGSGINYTTDINISGFTPGITVQNATDIDKMCVKIEHSYLGDLEMMLTCPNGQTVNIFNSYSGSNGLFNGGFGGSNDFLGGAYDNNTGNIGYCEEYCFSNVAGALPAWVNGYNTITASGPSSGVMVVPGLYEPEQSYVPALQGCPINGTWTLTVRDNIGIDDGYICEWGIYFNSTLHPNSEVYSPAIISDNWIPDTTIISNLDTNIIVQPANLGPNYYTFVVQDEYGCFHDTTITVQTIQGGSVMDNATTCDDFFQYTTNFLPPTGGVWSYYSNDGLLTFDDSTLTNPYVTVSDPGLYYLGLYDVFCQDTLIHLIEFFEHPEAYEFDDDTICFGEEAEIILSNSNVDFDYTWTDINGNTLASGDTLVYNSINYAIGSYDINLNVSNQCGDEQTTSQIIIQGCEIPNVITPNRDGENDVFYTHYAAIHNDVNLIVLNRWGKKVVDIENYQNDWNGVNNRGKSLADGVYYFFLIFNNGQEKFQGSLQIIDSSN